MPSTNTTPTPDANSSTRPAIAIIGLGEVGRIYGAALAAAGHNVTGYDPYTTEPSEGITVVDRLEHAVERADMVFTLTPAAASHSVAQEVAGVIRPRTIFADFTSSAPHAKQALTGLFAGLTGVQLVDVAILGPVVQLGATTPLMAAGPGAAAVASVMQALGADVQVVDGALGDAMGHKLVRSVFMKSLAAAVTEAVHAGRSAGHEQWIREQIARELSGDGQQTINRFLRGTVFHASRRAQEMESATEYLRQLGINPTMSQAAATLHRELHDSASPERIDH